MRLRRLGFHSVVDAYGGHGRVALELARQFLFRNLTLDWYATNYHWDLKGIPRYLHDCFRKQDVKRGGFTWIYAQCKDVINPRTVRYVVHETEDIPREDIEFLMKNSVALATPSDWNRIALKRRGYRKPITTLPHGVLPDFNYAPQRQDGKVIFGTVGELRNKAGMRKNPLAIVKAFQNAFPHRFDGSVELWIKTQPCTLLREFHDPRVRLFTEHLDQQGMVDWYKQISVYVNGSRGEGWCMPMHEAMACGRPFISTNWGGPTQYLVQNAGWYLPYKLQVQPDGTFYAGQRQAEPDFHYLADLMRWIVEDGAMDLSVRGAVASQRAHQFSWNTAGAIATRLCEEHDLITEE